MKKVSSLLGLQSNSVRYSSYFRFQNIVTEKNINNTLNGLKKIQLPQLHQSKRPVRKAAILIPICSVDGQTSLLYTLRTSSVNSHKGQVSFPGGKHDTKDENLEHTAIRETVEEIGINPTQIKIWGAGHIFPARELHILPVVGHIINELDIKHLRVNKHEVEEVFSVSLENLCDPTKIGYTQFKNQYSTPVFLGGPRRIWGLTAILTHIFLKSLLPNSVYNHNIRFMTYEIEDRKQT